MTQRRATATPCSARCFRHDLAPCPPGHRQHSKTDSSSRDSQEAAGAGARVDGENLFDSISETLTHREKMGPSFPSRSVKPVADQKSIRGKGPASIQVVTTRLVAKSKRSFHSSQAKVPSTRSRRGPRVC